MTSPCRSTREPRSASSVPTAPLQVIDPPRSWPESINRPTVRPSSILESTVGILLQEPPSTKKTVRENVEEGMGEIRVKLDRFNEVAELMATDYSDELMEEMANSRRISTTPTPGTSIPSSNRRWTPCAARPRTHPSPTCRW